MRATFDFVGASATSQALVDNLNTSTVNLEAEMNRLGVDEETVESLGLEKRNLQNEIRGLSDNAENIYHRFPDLQFRYTRPSANFDDSQVKGLVAKVFICRDHLFISSFVRSFVPLFFYLFLRS